MNLSSSFGLALATMVIIEALCGTSSDLSHFFDFNGVLIVGGGTAAAASICFPLDKVLSLSRVFLLGVLGRRRIDTRGVITEILELSRKASRGLSALQEDLSSIRHDFLREAVELVSSGVMTEEEIRSTLDQRVRTVEARYYHEANMFRTIGRFPPAFGWLSLTLGLIGPLQKLGLPESPVLIGAALSSGLIAMLYALSVSNLVLIPIAENLTMRTQEEIAVRRLIVEGALMLKVQVNPKTMREGLNSFLLPGERVLRKAA